MIDYFSDEITDCINKSPEKNKTLTFLKLFELSVMIIKLFKVFNTKALLGFHCVWKFEKGRNIEFYLFSGKWSPFSNFFNKGFEIKLAISGTTVLVVRRSKTLNKKVPYSKSWPNHFKETVSWSIWATMDMRVFFFLFYWSQGDLFTTRLNHVQGCTKYM